MKVIRPVVSGTMWRDTVAQPSRRRFVQGLLGSSFLGAAAVRADSSPGPVNRQEELHGPVFNLVIEEIAVNFTSHPRMATAINGSIPAPLLRWREGEEVIINVTNRLRETTSLHWHGIILPYQMDGVPGLSYGGIAPGETFQFRFRVQQSGTYWYHSHSAFQEMTGLYGAIIVEPREGEVDRAERDHVLLLSEWTDENPATVFRKLKSLGHYYNFSQPTLPEFLRDIRNQGLSQAISRRDMFSAMRMKPTDLGDLSGATLHYLVNGRTADFADLRLFSPGERVRLRIINGAGNTFFDVRIPGLPMTVVQSDGINVVPITVDELRCGPGETYDVLVDPVEQAYTFFAETMDRSGYAFATLATRAGLQAPLPERRRIQWLSMSDMMGAGSHEGHTASPTTGHDHGAVSEPVIARHASTEFGPSTDMRVDIPRTNLDDPGVGLREATHRVLTLGDLRARSGPYDARRPGREIELHLTGNMERYTWSIDGLEYGQSTPIHFREGERLRVHLHNDTMMTHPMHLHGMWSDLEDAQGNFLTRRHTLPVQPGQRVSFSVTADAPGRWAWHCHLLLHMDAGMFREVIVA
ncbi:MAG: copper resistance system multicopper oxidase [Gammaproteobacteria bacterium]